MKLGVFETTVDLQDLGVFHKEYSGILSPLYDDEFVKTYIHDQFMENSSEYIRKYQDTERWKGFIESSQQYLPFDADKEIKILDIGSGAGNTIFPLIELYPNAHIVASDLSLPLLCSLRYHYSRHYRNHSCFIIQLNAEDIVFQENSVDLVVGGAILHHLYDPGKTIEQCYRVLKPGGIALFFEPFEIGNQIIGLIFKQLMQLNSIKKKSGCSSISEELIAPEIIQFFEAMIIDFTARKGESKQDSRFQYMDDKWLFTKDYFVNIAKTAGFHDVTIYPIHNLTNMFYDQIKLYLQIGLSVDTSCLPKWAVAHIREVDEHCFSPELRRELLIEGGIVFRKPG